MNYERIRLRPSQFESVTSLDVSEFDILLPLFKVEIDRVLRYTSRGTIRKNRLNYPLTLPSDAHVLFFTLTYLKLNPLQEQHGASFDMSQESVSRWFRLGEKALTLTLKKSGYVPCRDGVMFADWLKKASTALITQKQNSKDTEINELVTDGEHYFIDASDRGIQRPKDNEEQEEKYSGKHHCHTIKNTYVSNEKSEILYLGHTYEGRKHDKRMVDEELINFPDESFLWKDLGYHGYLPKNVHCFEPYKKPKNGELTKIQKQENQLIASVRIVVEHAIGGVKRCRIVKEIIRIYDTTIRDRVVEDCAALHNFRVAQRNPYKINDLLIAK